MNSFTTHFSATETEIVADESTGFASVLTDGDTPMNFWVLFVRGVAYDVWTNALTCEVVQSFPVPVAA